MCDNIDIDLSCVDMLRATCTAPINIALVKYWGKENEKLIIPLNDSISITLDQENLCAKTTVAIDPTFKDDRLWLNRKEEDVNNSRIQACLKEIRRRAAEGKTVSNEVLQWKVHICSVNNFPTAAGLASSAAGYACLVYCLAEVYNLKTELSDIARQGSGSSSRSIYGGFVQWCKGSKPDGSDSIARPIAPASHWPDLHVIILVVSDQKKFVGSTEGMQQSVRTSELLQHWTKHCVPRAIESLTKAIHNKDFAQLAEITMKSSNQLHAVCLDTYPPIMYLSDTSKSIIRLVHQFNDFHKQTLLGYTFDAGPNACLVAEERNVQEVLGLIHQYYPSTSPTFVRGLQYKEKELSPAAVQFIKMEPQPDGLKYIIHTKVGDGPKVVMDQSLQLLGGCGLPL